jgi:hypothetical protein
MERNAYARSRAHHRSFNFRFGFLAQSVALFAVAGVVLWTLLLSSFLPVHDATHWLRHLLGVLPCH